MEPRNQSAMREAISAMILTMVGGIVATMIPYTGILIYFAAAIFFLASRKIGFIITLPYVIAAYVFMGIFTDFASAIFDVLAPAIIAIVMGELSRLQRSQGEVLAKGMLLGLLFTFLSITTARIISGVSLWESSSQFISLAIQDAMIAGQLTQEAADLMMQMYEALLLVVPALLIIWSTVMVLFIYYFGAYLFRKQGGVIEKYFPFRSIGFSPGVVTGFLLISIGGVIAVYAGIVAENVMLYNLLLIGYFIFALQGMAVVTFFCMWLKVPKILFAAIVLLLFISTIGVLILPIIGMLDILFHFRARISGQGDAK